MCTNLMISVPANPGQTPPDTTPMYVSARALEMPGVLEQSAYVVPSNQSWPLAAKTPAQLQGWTTQRWTNTYGFVAVADSSIWGSIPTFNDGINTAGLSVGGLWLAPGTDYPPVGTASNQVSFFDFPAWLLGNFASVDDVEKALSTITVVGPPSTGSPDSIYYVPLHYIVSDRNGDSLVIEFLGGKLHHHRSKDGVLTNAPPYDWQQKNAENYFHLSPFGAATSVTGAGNPVGGGLVGLPGDALSSSRFVRATVLSRSVRKLPADGTGWLPAPGVLPGSKNPAGFAGSQQTAVTVALQLVQIAMGTPYGMLLERAENQPPTNPPTYTNTYGDYTMWCSVRDHTNGKYYLLSAFSGLLTSIDLGQIDFATAPGYPNNASFPILPQTGMAWCQDVTAQLNASAAKATRL